MVYYHVLSPLRHSSLNKRRRCGPPSWHMVSSFQVCPDRFHEDVTQGYGLLHHFVLGRCAHERYAWQDLDQPFARVVTATTSLNQVRTTQITGWLSHCVKWCAARGLVLAVVPTWSDLWVASLGHYPDAVAWDRALYEIVQAFRLGLHQWWEAFERDSILRTVDEVCDQTKNLHRYVS
jgi:hypothetical protein